MTPLSSSGNHWTERADAGSAVARVVRITETSTDHFRFDATTGGAAEIVERKPGKFRLIATSDYASVVLVAPGKYRLAPGTLNAIPLVEVAPGKFRIMPGATASAQLVQVNPGKYQIIAKSAHRATAFRLGTSSKIIFY